MIKNDLFIRACKQEPVERTPIWIMRQAGRYLPEYRAIREKNDFMTMCKTPELATEITLQPVELIGVDAAIIFSDILVLPDALGMPLKMKKGIGPVFENPIRSIEDFSRLYFDKDTMLENLSYVFDALSLTKRELKNSLPLIGFSGSPFTILTYIIEGKGTKTFSEVKKFIFSQEIYAHRLLEKLSTATANYLNQQLKAGADAVQIFDTWGGILDEKRYLEFSLTYIQKVIQKIKRTTQPIIVFSKGAHHSIEAISRSGADVIGLDSSMSLPKVKEQVGNNVALQGNLDPCLLYASKKVIGAEAKNLLDAYPEKTGHIFNLGHGILPDINPDNLKYLVHTVKNYKRI